jgi:hypothetical protein
MQLTVENAQQEGVRFVEIMPMSGFGEAPPKAGRMTIAYLQDRRNIVTIATAICHRNDEFDKLTGRAMAALNLSEGHTVQLRKPTRVVASTKAWLESVFRTYGE